MLALKLFAFAHGIKNRFAFVILNTGNRRFFGGEAAAARGDNHNLAFDNRVGIGGDAPAGFGFFNLRRHLAEVEGGVERLNLLHQLVGQLLARDDGQGGDVIDGLLRIQLRALAARAVENVDKMRLDVEQSQLEHRKKPDRACADDNGVCVMRRFHAPEIRENLIKFKGFSRFYRDKSRQNFCCGACVRGARFCCGDSSAFKSPSGGMLSSLPARSSRISPPATASAKYWRIPLR